MKTFWKEVNSTGRTRDQTETLVRGADGEVITAKKRQKGDEMC